MFKTKLKATTSNTSNQVKEITLILLEMQILLVITSSEWHLANNIHWKCGLDLYGDFDCYLRLLQFICCCSFSYAIPNWFLVGKNFPFERRKKYAFKRNRILFQFHTAKFIKYTVSIYSVLVLRLNQTVYMHECEYHVNVDFVCLLELNTFI